MKQCTLLLFLISMSFSVFGNELQIGVYRGHTIQRIDFSYNVGSYLIYGDSTSFGALLPNEFISVTKVGNRVELKKGVNTVGTFKKISLKPTSNENVMRLRPRTPILKERKYNDGFIVFSGSKGLTIVNDVSYNHYLGGVVESEGGGGKHVEYYKAQAVISRTYALKYINRHQKEGFNLCDQVHCQAYHNKLIYTDAIRTAVNAVDGEYIIDTVSNSLVEGFFHANCGGQTSSSDYVWKEDIPYLQPFKDTFCIYTRQATWEKRVSKIEWRKFLVNTYFYPIEDSLYRAIIYNFEQEDRKAFYISPHLGIPLRDIRYQFKLRSTLFSCYPEGQDVVLKGRGYGHGVGFCQEGAMGMANQGLNYKQILSFYFEGIKFKHYFEKMFFNQSSYRIGEL
ncbi:SpoIID/LytB domain-containing protein [Brumimicrobium mesophilum]|uniref:SpoIID/LytB domain-containing protein n=1 Tax=Brumimicrobium mesophilum TaxID=392717 RepID=UPI000D13FF76|nr:SpoIID/LytB domain-containing protein [Brumimicrobium mesophilum]